MRLEVNPENPENRKREEIEKQIEENYRFLLDMINILRGLISVGFSHLSVIIGIIIEYMIGKRTRENIVQDLQNIIIPINSWMNEVSQMIDEVRASVNNEIETNYRLLNQLRGLISPDEFEKYVNAFRWTVTTIIDLINSLESIVRNIYTGINEMAYIHFEKETVRRLLEKFKELENVKKKFIYDSKNGYESENGQSGTQNSME
jgi:hypothetical protein